MVCRGKVWLLRKINREKDKDYISNDYSSQRLDGFGSMNEVRMRLTCFPKTIAFISKCFNWDK